MDILTLAKYAIESTRDHIYCGRHGAAWTKQSIRNVRDTTSALSLGRIVARVMFHEAGTKLGELADKFSTCFG